MYEIECIGGNHTREAIQSLHNEDPEIEHFITWPMRLYCGLSDSQALAKGHEHNKLHDTSRRSSFEDLTKYFRKELTSQLQDANLLNTDGTFPSSIPHKNLMTWKRRLSIVMFGSMVSTFLLLQCVSPLIQMTGVQNQNLSSINVPGHQLGCCCHCPFLSILSLTSSLQYIY